jgi:hypothetical protein
MLKNYNSWFNFITAQQIHIENDNLHQGRKYNIESKCDNKINFSDLTLHRKENNIEFDIFHKPAQIDMVIHSTSKHLQQHRMLSLTVC